MYEVRFICPHCGKEADLLEEEACPVSNSVLSFDVIGWEEDEDGEFVKAVKVETDWGLPQVHEPDVSHPVWLCEHCLEEVDHDIKTSVDLFNWLHKHQMLAEVDNV